MKDIFNFIDENKNNDEIITIDCLDISFEDIEVTKKLVDMRNYVNNIRKINLINAYKRVDKDERIEFQSMLSEFKLSMYFKNNNGKNSKYKVKVPEVASLILDKDVDYKLSYFNKENKFDLKSTYLTSRGLTVNCESHHRLIELGLDFYCVAVINNLKNDFDKFYSDIDKVYYLILPLKVFNEYARKVERYIDDKDVSFYVIDNYLFIDAIKRFENYKD